MILHPALQAHYEKLRHENEKEQEKRLADCRVFVPRAAQIADELRGLLTAVGRGKMTPAAALDLQRQLREEASAALQQAGFPTDYLDPAYHCPYCEDTGFVGAPLKRPCSCHLLLLQQHLAQGARINHAETFENFDESLFPEEAQRKQAIKAARLCEEYADALPRPQPVNLLILGQTGLGKSFLGNAMAHRAIENGVHALRTTAYRFIGDITDGFSDHKARLPAYLEPDFLVLDDLGTEPVMQNVSAESVFALLNERLLANKATCIITNLSLNELNDRYSERVASRLLDRELFRHIKLSGANLRYEKGGT